MITRELRLDPTCVKISSESEGPERLVKFLKEHRVRHLSNIEFLDFREGLIDQESYVNIDREPSLSDIVGGEIAILDNNASWPKELKRCLIENESWLIALSYDSLKTEEIVLSGDSARKIQELRECFYRKARRKEFEFAKRKNILERLYSHYVGFLQWYVDGTEDSKSVLEGELKNCKAIYDLLKK